MKKNNTEYNEKFLTDVIAKDMHSSLIEMVINDIPRNISDDILEDIYEYYSKEQSTHLFNKIDEVMENTLESAEHLIDVKKYIKEMVADEIRKTLREYRRQAYLSISEVALALHVKESTIRGYESTTKGIDAEIVEKLCEMYKANINELIKDVKNSLYEKLKISKERKSTREKRKELANMEAFHSSSEPVARELYNDIKIEKMPEQEDKEAIPSIDINEDSATKLILNLPNNKQKIAVINYDSHTNKLNIKLANM